jgi:methionyl-tRNA formyltransferase
MKIIFLGTPKFASNILEEMIVSGYKPEMVITGKDKPFGRGNKIKESFVSEIAKKNNIKTIKPSKLNESIREIKKIKPDLMIVVAYGKMIPLNIIKIPKYGIINIHPSLLPKHRGCAPIQSSIINNDKKTGVTIILINDKMDEGDILSQKECLISENDNYESLSEKLNLISSNLLIETIPKWINNQIVPQKQENFIATYSKFFSRKDGRINWSDSADNIYRIIKALNPWPGSYTFFKTANSGEKMLKIIEAGIVTDIKKQEKVPGKTGILDGNISVQTGKGIILIKKLQIEGKKIINSKDYLNGSLDLINIILK